MGKKNNSTRAKLDRLKINESFEMPIEKIFSVKSEACRYGKLLGKKFVCNQDVERRVIVVKRVRNINK